MPTNFDDLVNPLGYSMKRNVKDVFGVNHKYCVYPSSGGGGINYFDSLVDIRTWVTQVEWVRAVQEGNDDLAHRLSMILSCKKSGVSLVDALKFCGEWYF